MPYRSKKVEVEATHAGSQYSQKGQFNGYHYVVRLEQQ